MRAGRRIDGSVGSGGNFDTHFTSENVAGVVKENLPQCQQHVAHVSAEDCQRMSGPLQVDPQAKSNHGPMRPERNMTSLLVEQFVRLFLAQLLDLSN